MTLCLVAQENEAPVRDRIFYTEGVEAHWIEAIVGAHGELVLEGLPFEPGQPVEVLVVSKAVGPVNAAGHEPSEPVAGEDWDALQ
jgi:hypothetical protein